MTGGSDQLNKFCKFPCFWHCFAISVIFDCQLNSLFSYLALLVRGLLGQFDIFAMYGFDDSFLQISIRSRLLIAKSPKNRKKLALMPNRLRLISPCDWCVT